jgi:hypothetical protein
VTRQVNLQSPELSALWAQRVDALGIALEKGPLAPLIQRLYGEMQARGLTFFPPCFVANEWGCPDMQPLIGVPFYLADARFHEMEEDYADDLEDDTRIMAGLRHEAGHAINYAYKLWLDPEWVELFGSFHREYDDDYRCEPFSRRCVRHLPGWYAQKHPDEDFAETFAVWLTPGLNWRDRFSGWEALRKLEYVDRVMARVGALPPVVDPATCEPDPDELAFTVEEFYRDRQDEDSPPLEAIGPHLDDDLRELFPAEGLGTDASSLLWDRRKSIMRSVSGYTGARMYVVKALIDHIAQRLRALGLRAAAGSTPSSASPPSSAPSSPTSSSAAPSSPPWSPFRPNSSRTDLLIT